MILRELKLGYKRVGGSIYQDIPESSQDLPSFAFYRLLTALQERIEASCNSVIPIMRIFAAHPEIEKSFEHGPYEKDFKIFQELWLNSQ